MDIRRLIDDWSQALRGPLKAWAYILVTVLLLACLWIVVEAEKKPPATTSDQNSHGWASIALAKIAYVVLIGASTAIFTRFLGGIGMFRDAIADVLGGDAWLDRRNDLEDLWRRITRRIFLPGFREEAKDSQEFLMALNEAMTEVVNRPERRVNYYVKNFKRWVDIRWQNKEDGIVEIIDTLDFEVIPFDESIPCQYDMIVVGMAGGNMNEYKILLRELKINGDTKDVSKITSITKENRSRASIPLSGCSVYKVYKKTSYIQNLNSDPVFVAAAGRVIWGMDSTITCKAEGLRINFEEVGVDGAFRPIRDDVDGGVIQRETRKVLLPEHGFLVVMAKI